MCRSADELQPHESSAAELKKNECLCRKQLRSWGATLSAAYFWLHTKSSTSELGPETPERSEGVAPAPVQSCWVKEHRPKSRRRTLIGQFVCSVSERCGGTRARLISRSEVGCRWRDMWTPPSRQMSRAEQSQEGEAGCRLLALHNTSYLPEPTSRFSPMSRNPNRTQHEEDCMRFCLKKNPYKLQFSAELPLETSHLNRHQRQLCLDLIYF